MKRVLNTLAVVSWPLFTSLACSQIEPHLSGSKEAQSSSRENVGYYYFLCDATSRDLNDASRLVCEEDQCIYLSLIYQVSDQGILEKGDSCQILWTATRDSRSPDAEVLGTYAFRGDGADEINILRVPDNAMLSGSGDVRVEYPALGSYKFWLTRARYAVAISAVP